jgi:hypothetical protein
VLDADLLALRAGREVGGHAAHPVDAAGDGRPGATRVLDRVRLHRHRRIQVEVGGQRPHVVDLAAEPDDQHGADVRVAGVAAQRPAQHVPALAAGRHPATRPVGERLGRR